MPPPTHRAKYKHDEELRRYQELAEADPFNAEVQQKIEELIQQKNIEESYEYAMEHTPEVRGWGGGRTGRETGWQGKEGGRGRWGERC